MVVRPLLWRSPGFNFRSSPHIVRKLCECVDDAWDTRTMTARELDRVRAKPIALISHHYSNFSVGRIRNSVLQHLQHTLLNLYLLSVSYGVDLNIAAVSGNDYPQYHKHLQPQAQFVLPMAPVV